MSRLLLVASGTRCGLMAKKPCVGSQKRCTKRGGFSQNLLTSKSENSVCFDLQGLWVREDRVMGLCKDPPPPQARCIPIRKELIHWYFLFPPTSRILPSLADFSPGRSRAAVRAAVPVCGGTALSSPISPVVLKRCIYAAFAAPTAAALSVSAPAAFFAEYVRPFSRFCVRQPPAAVPGAGIPTCPAAGSVSGGDGCTACCLRSSGAATVVAAWTISAA